MKALVVDDDPASRLLLRRFLEKYFECTVVEATDGGEALGLIEQEEPQIVFLDLMMPVIDGITALKTIRSDDTYKELPIIMISSVSDKALLVEMKTLGITDYLLKPWNFSVAKKRLERIFNEIFRPPEEACAPPDTPEDKAPNRPVLLLVDRDPDFRRRVSPELQQRFTVVEAASGVQALQLSKEHRADIVCIGEKLGLLNETLLAGALRTAADTPRIYLLVESSAGREDDAAIFDGVLERAGLVESIEALRHQPPGGEDHRHEGLYGISQLRARYIPLIQEKTGYTPAPQDAPAVSREISQEMNHCIEYADTAAGVAFALGIWGAREDFARIAAMVANETTGEADEAPSLQPFLTLLAEQAVRLLAPQGIDLQPMSPPILERQTPAPRRWPFVISFHGDADQRFLLAWDLRESK